MWSKLHASFTSARLKDAASKRAWLLQNQAGKWAQEAVNTTKTRAKQATKDAQEAAYEKTKSITQQTKEAAYTAGRTTRQAVSKAAENATVAANDFTYSHYNSAKQSSLKSIESTKQSSLKSVETAKQTTVDTIKSIMPSFRWLWWWSLAAVGVFGLAYSIPRQVRLAIENRRKENTNQQEKEQ